MVENPLMKYWQAPDGTVFEVCDKEAREAAENCIQKEQLSEAVNTALAQAKESGDFDGADGKDGRPGSPGKDGISVTITGITESDASGGKNVVAFSDGNSLKIKNGKDGKDGSPGSPGSPGKDGTSVTITGITESDASGGENVVIFSGGETLTVKNGKDGSPGSPGSPGKDGDNYVLTEADKQEIAEMAAELVDVPGGGETPGVDGEDGGYYTPTVTQPNANTMRVAFSPSKSDMPSVAEKDIALPSGLPGADGEPGQDGKDGVGISAIKQTTTSAEDGGSNVFTVTLTNGQTATFTVKNGSKGSQGNPGKDGSPGADGSDGDTPARGTDYWTDDDIAEIKSYVDKAILGGAW